jgi:hypothetical protein
LLVGKTSSSTGVAGARFSANGFSNITRDGGECINFNRLTSDGTIVDFRKDSTTVGSIGVDNSNNLYIQGDTTNSGIQCGTNAVLPHQSGADVDATIALGGTTRRFTSLHLSGGLINDNASGVLTFRTNSSERMRIDSSGNVGIGTTSPSSPLSFGKAVYGDSSSENFFRIKFSDVGGTANDVGIGQPDQYSLGFNINPNGFISFNRGTSGEAMRIGASGNLGIGTASPDNVLHVKHATTNVVAKFESGDNQVWINLNDDGGGTYGALLGHDSDAGHMFAIADSSVTKKFVIDGAGNVGINTTQPSNKFHVNSGNSNTVAVFESTDATSRIVLKDNSGEVHLNGIGDNLTFGTSSSGSERMRIDSSGNVGIGTSSPSAALNIVKSGLSTQFRISNTVSDATIKYGAIVGSHYTNAEEPITGMLMTSSSSSTGGSVSIGGGISAANAVNKIIFYTAANNTTLTGSERMRIDTSGNVGIGTTSPSANLHVLSSGNGEIEVERASGALINLQAQSARGVIGTDSNHELQFKTNSSSRMTINTSGNVGIGTSSPDTKLHVEGGSVLIDAYSVGENAGLFFREGFLTTDQPSITVFDMSNSGASPDGLSINAFDGIRFRNAGAEVARFSNEKLGIGTTSPSSLLHLESASSPALQLKDTTNNVTFKAYAQNSNTHLANTSNHDLIIDTNNTERIRILAGGNVGIGTTSPAQKLEVAGRVRATTDPTFEAYESSSKRGGIQWDATNDYTNLFSVGGPIRFDVGGERMRIDSSGNVGIGTTGPDAPLDINGNRLRIRTARTIANADDNGEVGEISWDANYLYVCVNTDTWKRAALSTW